MTIPLSSLIVGATKQAIYDVALSVAVSVGLPVTSWSPGDPTRSLYWMMAETLHTFEQIVVGYVSSGFLDLAAADPSRYDWLVLLADQVYGYTADPATYASTPVILTNGGGGLFTFEAGDVQLKSSTTDQTYTSTSGGTLASGVGNTISLDFDADESGSDGSAAAGEIDTVITSLLLVTCANAAATVGTDVESASSIVAGCRASLGPLSPSGPWDAYDSVVKNSALTGTTGITRSRTFHDSTTGNVTVYLAGPSGAVSGADVTAAEEAIATWALPLCITPTVTSATSLTTPVTYELWLYDSVGLTESEIEEAADEALEALFLVRPIGGDIKASVGSGQIFYSAITSAIRGAFPNHFVDVDVSSPAADVAVTESQVPTLGAVTLSALHLEEAPE